MGVAWSAGTRDWGGNDVGPDGDVGLGGRRGGSGNERGDMTIRPNN